MKRPLGLVVAMGLIAAGVASVLHAIGALRPIEQLLGSMVQNAGPASLAGEFWVYFTAVVLALVTAWLTVSSLQRGRIGWLVVGLAVELLLAAWVCALYGIRFQPLPAIIAIGIAFVATER